MGRRSLAILSFVLLPLMASCASTHPSPQERVREIDAAMASPERNTTRFDGPVQQFGTLLRSYPVALNEAALFEVPPVENISGVTDGLPTDLAPVWRVILGKMGDPVEVMQFDRDQLAIDAEMIRLQQMGQTTMDRHAPRFSIRGSITEAESRSRRGRGIQLDALIPVRSGNEAITTHPGGSVTTIERDEEIDGGLSKEQEIEVITLVIDLQLYDYRSMTSIDRLAESYRIDVVRVDNSVAFGIFFEGSGIGIRSRSVAIQSKGRALRMASELALIHLLGRYFRVPWWRVVTDTPPDEQLVTWYHDALPTDPNIVGRLKGLLFAHGLDADLYTSELNDYEIAASRQLKQQRFGLDPAADNDFEFITRLWETAPFDARAERRMNDLRRITRRQALLRALGHTTPVQPQPAPAGEDLPNDRVPQTQLLSYPTVTVCCPIRFPDHDGG